MRLMYETDQWTSGRRFATKMPDEQMREITAITYGMVSFIDEQVGRILDKLDELGLADNTVVVFTADHGDLLGDHWLLNKGPFHFDGMLNIPFHLALAGAVPSGQSLPEPSIAFGYPTHAARLGGRTGAGIRAAVHEGRAAARS